MWLIWNDRMLYIGLIWLHKFLFMTKTKKKFLEAKLFRYKKKVCCVKMSLSHRFSLIRTQLTQLMRESGGGLINKNIKKELWQGRHTDYEHWGFVRMICECLVRARLHFAKLTALEDPGAINSCLVEKTLSRAVEKVVQRPLTKIIFAR